MAQPHEASIWNKEQREDIAAMMKMLVDQGAADGLAYTAIVSAASNLVALASFQDDHPALSKLMGEFECSVMDNRQMIAEQRGDSAQGGLDA